MQFSLFQFDSRLINTRYYNEFHFLASCCPVPTLQYKVQCMYPTCTPPDVQVILALMELKMRKNLIGIKLKQQSMSHPYI